MSCIVSFAQGYCGGLIVLAVGTYCFYRYIIHPETLRKRTMPDGMSFWAGGADNGSVLIYWEMFIERVYFRNGITLAKDTPSLVVDVGANIGLFALSVASRYPLAQIVSVEPVPVLCEAAVRNIKPFQQRVQLYPVGLSDKRGPEVTFRCDLGLSAGSSMCGSEILSPGKKHSVIEWTRSLLLDSIRHKTFPSIVIPIFSIIANCLHPSVSAVIRLGVFWSCLLPLWVPMLLYMVSKSAACTINVRCRLETLDDVMKQSHSDTPPIDLLKIDCEGSEWRVLQGITASTWKRIQQVVVEVHDIDDRLTQIVSLLTSQGFASVLVQDEELETHKLLRMSTVFASRKINI